MKKIICILFFFYTVINASNDMDRIILTKDDIQSSGYFRISDIIKINTTGSFYTIHGFLDYLNLNGLESFQHQNYNILINKHGLNLNYLGANSINSLPIDLNSLDSIEIIHTPVLHFGKINDAGTIIFHTQRLQQKNYYLKNLLIIGNESKDTGPYRFTSKNSPNVDKIGTDYTGSLAYKLPGHQIEANYHYRQHIYTDWSTRNRIRQLKTEKQWPMLLEYGGALMSSGNLMNNQYSVLFSTIKTENMYYYYEPVGHEFPLDYYNNSIGFNLSRDLSQGLNTCLKLDYATQYTDHKLRAGIREHQSGVETFRSTLAFRFNNQSILRNAGIHLDTERLLTTIENDDARIIPGFFLDFSLNLFTFGTIRFSEVFKIFDNKIYDKYLVSIQNKKNQKLNFKFNISASQHIFDYTINDLWLQKKYLFPNLKIIQQKQPNRKYTADLFINYKWKPDISISTNLFSRYFEKYNYLTYDFHFDNENFSFYSPTIFDQPASGFVQGITVSSSWQQTQSLRSRFAITYLKAMGDSPGFNNAWARIPGLSANYQLTYQPTPSFSMQLVIKHTSESQWPDYENISGIEYFSTFKEKYYYDHQLNSRNRIDINIRKDIWRRKLSIKFMLRNISDQKIYYAPIGASFDMSLLLGIGYNFN